MALRKPLVVMNGQIQQLQAGDTLDGVAGLTNPLNADLDVQNHVIKSTAGNVEIDPKNGYNLVLDGISWPNALGTKGSVLTDVDGIGQPTWVVPFQKVAANLTLYVDTTGSDITGTGLIEAPWASIAKALDWLKDKWINADATVTISVANGIYTATTPVVIAHPCGNRIAIVARNTPSTKSLVSILSTAGAAGTFSITLNLNDVTEIAVDDFVTFSGLAGNAEAEMLYGCWRVTNVDTGNNRITVLSTSRSATQSSATCTGTLTILKVQLRFTGCSGIQVVQGGKLGSLTNIVLRGDGTAGKNGLEVNGGGNCAAGLLGIVGFERNLYVDGSSYFYATGLRSSSATAAFAAIEIRGCSQVDIPSSHLCGNAGTALFVNAAAKALSAMVNGNGRAVYVAYQAVFSGDNLHARRNTLQGVYCSAAGIAWIDGAVVQYNAGGGCMAEVLSFIHATGATCSGNTSFDYSPALNGAGGNYYSHIMG